MTHTSHSTRRSFLRDVALVAAGGIAATSVSRFLDGGSNLSSLADAADETDGPSPEARVKELGLELPPSRAALAIYVPAVLVGDMLYVSGTGPRKSDGEFIVGRVGSEITLEDAQAAARLTGLNILTAVREALGSLDRVDRIVKVLGMVNCEPTFTQQPRVINGFSQLMVDIFGEKRGKGARSAVGMGSLPGNMPVEIEAIFKITG